MVRKLIVLAVALVVLFTGLALFRHYNDAYGLRLNSPNESWLHDLPWDYEELFGDAAEHVENSVYFGTGAASVVSMKQTLGPFTSLEQEQFERGFERGVRKRTQSAGRCRAVKVDDVTWNCFEWKQTFDGEPMRQRAYLTGRGITKFVVVFTAPVDGFSAFGNQRRWLSDVEWLGPGLIHAITDASPLEL